MCNLRSDESDGVFYLRKISTLFSKIKRHIDWRKQWNIQISRACWKCVQKYDSLNDKSNSNQFIFWKDLNISLEEELNAGDEM